MKNEKKSISKDGNPMNTKGINEAKASEQKQYILTEETLTTLHSQGWIDGNRDVVDFDLGEWLKKFNIPVYQRESGESKPLGEGERVFRRVSVKERLPEKPFNYFVIHKAGIAIQYFNGKEFQDDSAELEKKSNPIEYWLEEVPTDAVSKSEADLYKALEKIEEGNYGSAKNFIERYINTAPIVDAVSREELLKWIEEEIRKTSFEESNNKKQWAESLSLSHQALKIVRDKILSLSKK